ncbi:hypothetical protein CEXT_411551 [Caerostris extrusa]|uniref:Uncharacterized protein n=1 Tax=Caerostris extrusa TaxID=172846 RepID=A0AAV4NSB9_CAEEX|nr:hypothetical protein CEXT_411551 [Caerostris extrusa]
MREEFGVTYLDTSANPKRLIPTKGIKGWGSFPLSNFENPFVNSLLNPWSSNRIEIAHMIGSASWTCRCYFTNFITKVVKVKRSIDVCISLSISSFAE